jgi:hypothetical protein
MSLNPEDLEVEFEGCAFGVSARRMHEHMTLGQVNPFGRSVSSVRSQRDVTEVIDLVCFHSLGDSLTGMTLAGLDDPALSSRILGADAPTVRHSAAQRPIRAFLADVQAAAHEYAARRAARNVPAPFLPAAARGDPFGVPLLRSKLCDRVATRARAKASAAQWLGTVRNLAQKGLRGEELERSGLIDFLDAAGADALPLAGKDLVQAIDFSALRISVIANITEARTQLRFEVVPDRRLARIKGEAKPQAGQRRRLCLFDRVLGYRIEEVEHAALWGQDRHWQAVTFDGRVLRNRVTRRAIFASPEEAAARAQEHAREVLPKLLASERWADWSWTGGEEYREWLITLPCYPASYFSGHFVARNVLAHVRCDLREGADGERVLMLHEVQSDWAQESRRAMRDFDEGHEAVPLAPFLNEWPALTFKLMLLHAAHLGVDALGWTRGAHQVHRYRGLGAEGLKKLYDHTLPREANRMVKPYGMACETVEVYVPENFKIRRIEGGFEVRTPQDTLLAVAPTFREARDLLPDGAHERLYGVHGVRLSKAARAAILENGFSAWG